MPTIRMMLALAALASTPLANAASSTAIDHWQIQSSSKAQESGAEVSSAGFSTKRLVPGERPRDSDGGALGERQVRERVLQRQSARGRRTRIQRYHVRDSLVVSHRVHRGRRRTGTRTLLRINGMIPSADVWLNGNLVADQATVAGAYPVHEFDVTRWVHAGANTLALRVYPGDPRTSLTIGWVDWNPTPPDNNMGPWRGVDIVRTGPVQIRFPRVTSDSLDTGSRARRVDCEGGGAKPRCVGARRAN